MSGAGLAQVQWNQRNAAIEAPGLTLGHLPDPAADEERLCRHPESLTQIIAAAGASHQNSSVLTAFFGKEVEDSAEVDRLCVKRPVERIHVAEVEYLHCATWCIWPGFWGGYGIGNHHGGFMIPRISSRIIALVSGVLALLFTSLSALAQPLVDAAWAVANAGKPGIVFVDLQPQADYLKGHIPGAVNTNYGKDGWREDRARDKVPDMFPEKIEPLVALIGKLGIDSDTHVVLVPPGYNVTDMGAGTRVYWTFKVLGHDKVSILNGGMNAYTNDDKRPVQTGAVTPAAKVFKANLRQDMLITMEDVKKAQAAGQLLIDARPEDQYVGINRHPKSTQSGTIAGAKSVPHNWMAVNGGGVFRPKAQVEQLYAVANVVPTGEHIQFCNTGHWASIGWFVASEIVGNKQSKMYDGSMVEWTMLKGGPVESRVKLQ